VARTLGSEIQKVRKLRGMSLNAVAKPAGLSATYLQKLERDQVESPSPHRLHAISVVLDLDYGDLLRLAGYPVPREDGTVVIAGDGSGTTVDGVDLATADASLLRKVFQSADHVSDQELEQLSRYLAFLRQERAAIT
jgi:transcriptional regulator with XRE-family HTH domain